MQHITKNLNYLLKVGASCLLLALSTSTYAQMETLAGEWRGTYNINIGGDRDIVFTIEVNDGEVTGIFDDEAAGAMGLTIETISIEGKEVQFSIPRINGAYFGTIHADLGTDGNPVRIDGDWTQAGEFIPVTIYRTQ